MFELNNNLNIILMDANFSFLPAKGVVLYYKDFYWDMICKFDWDETLEYNFNSTRTLSITRVTEEQMVDTGQGFNHKVEARNETVDYPIDDKELDRKTILRNWLINYASDPRKLYQPEEEWISDVFSREELAAIFKRALEVREDFKRQIQEFGNNSAIIQFCKENHLLPEAPGGSLNNWYANCPSRRPHRIMVSASNDTFGCGYCRKKGGIKELAEWIQSVALEKK